MHLPFIVSVHGCQASKTIKEREIAVTYLQPTANNGLCGLTKLMRDSGLVSGVTKQLGKYVGNREAVNT